MYGVAEPEKQLEANQRIMKQSQPSKMQSETGVEQE